VLSPFDDYPIHPSADPIAHPATGDPNHYDRYWFNGHQRAGEFYFGAAMGHYPVRGDLTFRATTVAVEEPRQRTMSPDGVLTMDHTRLTQWGTWEGTISVDGDDLRVDPAQVPGTRDRSWGMRPVGQQLQTNRPPRIPQVFWMWAPLHFGDRFTHLALHEYSDGSRWLESALVLDPIREGAAPWSTEGVRECRDIRYAIEWEPGRREMRRADLRFTDPAEGEVEIALEKVFTFRMRGIGYSHPYWAHGSNHGDLETGRESIKLDDFDPLDLSSIHIQNLVIARMGDRTGVGVLEQFAMGAHAPTGLTGFLDGHGS
jgi:hypothetical protein